MQLISSYQKILRLTSEKSLKIINQSTMHLLSQRKRKFLSIWICLFCFINYLYFVSDETMNSSRMFTLNSASHADCLCTLLFPVCFIMQVLLFYNIKHCIGNTSQHYCHNFHYLPICPNGDLSTVISSMEIFIQNAIIWMKLWIR